MYSSLIPAHLFQAGSYLTWYLCIHQVTMYPTDTQHTNYVFQLLFLFSFPLILFPVVRLNGNKQFIY